MAPFVPDGVYKIRNSQFPDSVADLFNYNQRDLVVGNPENSSIETQEWRIRNVGNGGNQITIENVGVPGSFANFARQFPGSQLVGSTQPAIWTVVKEDNGTYYLQSPDAKLVWSLYQPDNNYPILLVPFTGKEPTKWTFDQIGE